MWENEGVVTYNIVGQNDTICQLFFQRRIKTEYFEEVEHLTPMNFFTVCMNLVKYDGYL